MLLIVYIPVLLVISLSSWHISQEDREFNSMEGCNCRRYCEWQITHMNKTCDALIGAYEERLQKLHRSDMNNALIREQLQKEFVELFQYEVQTFQGYYDTRVVESSSHLCTKCCTSLETQLKDCRENVTKLLSENVQNSHQCLQQQYRLRLQLQHVLHEMQNILSCAELSRSMGVTALSLLIVLATVMTCLTLYQQHKVFVHSVIIERLKLQAQKSKNVMNNAHKFWQEWQSKSRAEVREMKKALNSNHLRVRSLEKQLSTLEMRGLKQKHELTREVVKSHERVLELEMLLKRDDRRVERQLVLAKKVKDQEEIIKSVEQEIKSLQTALTVQQEKGEIACKLEKEHTFQILQRNSSLESEILALKKQTAQLEEGLLAKVSKASKVKRVLSSARSSMDHRKDQASQTMDNLQDVDSRLTEIRQEFESRLIELQRTVDENLAMEAEEAKLLRMEHEELSMQLELANKRCTFLEKLAYQMPSQPQILMCSVDGLKLSTSRSTWRQPRDIRDVNDLTVGLLKDDVNFLTPPFIHVSSIDATENHLSTQ